MCRAGEINRGVCIKYLMGIQQLTFHMRTRKEKYIYNVMCLSVCIRPSRTLCRCLTLSFSLCRQTGRLDTATPSTGPTQNTASPHTHTKLVRNLCHTYLPPKYIGKVDIHQQATHTNSSMLTHLMSLPTQNGVEGTHTDLWQGGRDSSRQWRRRPQAVVECC